MTCPVCNKRKAKRQCPGINSEICTQCCGAERENSITCPLDCPYLVEGHRYEWERNRGEPLAEIPYPKYEILDNFLYHNEQVVSILCAVIFRKAIELPGTLDSDVREALDGVIKTRETLESGLVYESVPTTPLPEAIFREVQKFLEETLSKVQIKSEDVLKCLVFLARLAAARNNGRPKCRSFLEFLQQQFPQEKPASSGLIIPG